MTDEYYGPFNFEHRTKISELDIKVLEKSLDFLDSLKGELIPGFASIRQDGVGHALVVGIESVRSDVAGHYCCDFISATFKNREGFMPGTVIPQSLYNRYVSFLRKEIPGIYFIGTENEF